MNVLLAREVRGAQDTIRELVAMGSRILALAVGLGAPVDLTSQPSDSLGPSVCGATGALLHAACITPVARCTTARRPRRRASAGPQTRESQTRHRRWDMYRRRGGGGHAGAWGTRTGGRHGRLSGSRRAPAVRMRSYTAVIECGCVFPVTCSMFRVCVRVSRLRVSPDASASRDRTRVAV